MLILKRLIRSKMCKGLTGLGLVEVLYMSTKNAQSAQKTDKQF
jgi:hypothetical protein